MEEKTMTIKLIKYRMRGITKFKDWYGGISYIELKPVDFDYIPNTKQMEDGLNDNGFGCQAILGGYVTLYEVYENNVEMPIMDSVMLENFTEDDLSNLELDSFDE